VRASRLRKRSLQLPAAPRPPMKNEAVEAFERLVARSRGELPPLVVDPAKLLEVRAEIERSPRYAAAVARLQRMVTPRILSGQGLPS
jgi:hypothetical protein